MHTQEIQGYLIISLFLVFDHKGLQNVALCEAQSPTLGTRTPEVMTVRWLT